MVTNTEEAVTEKSFKETIFYFSAFRFKPDIEKMSIEDGLIVYRFDFDVSTMSNTIEIKWLVPSNDMQFVWSSQQQTGPQPNWGEKVVTSHATSQAPVVSILNNNNVNQLTFAASDALNTLTFYCGVIEENGMIENKVVIEPEAFEGQRNYQIELRIDKRSIPYWQALADVSNWWENFAAYKPLAVPDVAKRPLYSTWYNFHQRLVVDEVIAEAKLAKCIGCDAITVDDGWQTMDSNRGYSFTGDWQPDRIPNMKNFVESVHALDMKFLLWYSVPFVGEKSVAAKKFTGKFIHHSQSMSAYVFDPRYPDVRAYLIQTYVDALNNWGLDGFKLDFVDCFKEYKNASYQPKNYAQLSKQMDFSNINEAADRLLTDVVNALSAIKPDILIEFRQSYIGPLMRKYGNMFRATDSPYSLHDNRIRTTNVKLLAGSTATHADMLMWHADEKVETAALQLLNVLFSVPQISVKLNTLPPSHFKMLRFWLSWWNENQNVLLDGNFEAYQPNLNYPLLKASNNGSVIVGVYGPNISVPINTSNDNLKKIAFVNASGDTHIGVNFKQPLHGFSYTVYNCIGEVTHIGKVNLSGLLSFEVPKSGLLEFTR